MRHAGIFFCLLLLSACRFNPDHGRKEIGSGNDAYVSIPAKDTSVYANEYHKANVLLSEGKPVEAETIYASLIRKEKPENKRMVYVGMAACKMGEEEFALADVYYDSALACDPHSATVLIGKGALYYRMHEYTEAIRFYGRAADEDPLSPDAMYGLAVSYDANGETSSAKVYARRFIELAPNSTYRKYAEGILNK